MRYFVDLVLSEDNAACEKLQAIAPQLSAAPMLGALEQRIAWFEEAYRDATGA